jgi:hypothetical protein
LTQLQRLTTSSLALFIIARVVTAGLLVWALARHPIGYFTVLRFVTCTVCLYGAYLSAKWKRTGWTFTLGAVALLFNPLVKFQMTRQTWEYVDVAVALLLVASIFWLRAPAKNPLSG